MPRRNQVRRYLVVFSDISYGLLDGGVALSPDKFPVIVEATSPEVAAEDVFDLLKDLWEERHNDDEVCDNCGGNPNCCGIPGAKLLNTSCVNVYELGKNTQLVGQPKGMEFREIAYEESKEEEGE